MNDQPAFKISDPFSRMAQRIDHNASEVFGGAFVIVPPVGAGAQIEALLLSANNDPANFWMVLQGQINKVLEELKNPQPYGRVR